jgi:hypothetical protein
MSTVVVWANKPTSPTDVAVNFFDQTKLTLRSQSFDSKLSLYQAEYVLSDGSPLTETTVSAQARINTDKSVRFSLLVRTVRTVTIDSVLAESGNADITIAWTVPSIQDDAAATISMIGSAFALLFNGVTTKVPNTGIISELQRFVVNQLYS